MPIMSSIWKDGVDTNVETGSESEREASEPLLNIETKTYDKEEVKQRQGEKSPPSKVLRCILPQDY